MRFTARRVAKFVVGGIVVFALALAVFGGVTMWLWNALVPSLFRGPVLTYWQALGLLLLSHILLRGGGPWRHRGGFGREPWRRRLREKLAGMTPEERERFHKEWGDVVHPCGRKAEGDA